MTELLNASVSVEQDAAGELLALQLDGRRRPVERTLARWLVETDWWRDPVHRDYRRCLLAGGDCVELCGDLLDGSWSLLRRYD